MSQGRVFLSWTTVWILFFQTLIPLGQAFASPNSNDPLIICTQLGPRVLEAFKNPSGSPLEGSSDRTADRAHCAVCARLDATCLLTPDIEPIARSSVVVGEVSFPQDVQSLRFETLTRRIWPRAPPV